MGCPLGVDFYRLVRLLKATGADAASLHPGADRQMARNKISPRCAVQGNLSPETLLAGGKQLDAEIDEILQDFEGVPHVFNLGHGILKETPIAHVEQMIARVRR
jgi:uroporphyrinogen decarboxylase